MESETKAMSKCAVWMCGLLIAWGATLVPGSDLRAQDAGAYSLERAIGIALANNRDLRQAELGLEVASQQVREAWGGLMPEVDGTVRYQRNLEVQEAFLPAIIFDPNASPDELVPVRFGADNNWLAELSVTQPLFDAGALVGVGTAGRFKELQRELVRGRAQQVVSRVRRTYYRALLARERVRVTEESVDRMEETLRETRGLNRAGLASSYDVLRLEVQLSNLRPDLRRAVNLVTAAERDLAVELGVGVSEIRVAGQLHAIDLASAERNEGANAELLRLVGYAGALDRSFAELYETATRMRSDLRQGRLDAQLERARVSFERTKLFPRLSAFLSYGITAQENGSLNPFGADETQRTTTAQVGVLLEVPLFSGFQRWSRLQQRKLALQQANVEVDQRERRARAEIRTALDALAEARLRAAAARAAVDQARRGFEIVSAQYVAGTSSQLEVTDGEVALRETEFNYAEAVYDYLVAQADLDEAVGIVPVVDPVVGPGDMPSLSYHHTTTWKGLARDDE